MTNELPTAGILDVDGVLLDPTARLDAHLDREALAVGDLEAFYRSYETFHAASGTDQWVVDGYKLARAMLVQFPVDKLFIVTNRSETARAGTTKQLDDAFGRSHPPYEILMTEPWLWEEQQAHFCHLKPKERHLELIQSEYRVRWAMDDHLGLCQMYQRAGIMTIHFLAPGIDMEKVCQEEDRLAVNPLGLESERGIVYSEVFEQRRGNDRVQLEHHFGDVRRNAG